MQRFKAAPPPGIGLYLNPCLKVRKPLLYCRVQHSPGIKTACIKKYRHLILKKEGKFKKRNNKYEGLGPTTRNSDSSCLMGDGGVDIFMWRLPGDSDIKPRLRSNMSRIYALGDLGLRRMASLSVSCCYLDGAVLWPPGQHDACSARG